MAVQTPGAAPAEAASTETSFEEGLALLADMDAEEGETPEGDTPTDETAAGEEEETLDADAEEETDEAKAAKAAEGDTEDLADDTPVKLPDGTVVKLADLTAAYTGATETKAETTRILQETASERSNLQVLGRNMATALENISNYLVDQLPPEPDQQLAYSDPAEHYRQTIQRQAAIAELRDVLSVAQGSREAVAMMSDAEFQAVKREEDQKWIAAVPSLKDPKRFQAADKKAREHARSLGYEEGEVNTTADHRLRKVFFQSARYEEIVAKAGTAKGKVENAPIKMPPAKAKSQHANSIGALEQVNAKKRLAKSGSLNDAMKIDFQ